MLRSFTEIRDKTFSILSQMDDAAQQEYAYFLQQYMTQEDEFREMSEYLRIFNQNHDLLAYMDDTAADFSGFEARPLVPELERLRDDLNKLYAAGDDQDAEKAETLLLFVLADLQDDQEWNKLIQNSKNRQQK